MVYDRAMLQDLDSLAARIGQMVQFTRQLQSERTALQARLKALEQERNALRDQLERREAEYQSMAERLERHQTEVDAVRAEAEVSQAELRVNAARYQAECEAARHSLQASREATTRLRSVAGAAKDRIDTILMRLPGAPQE